MSYIDTLIEMQNKVVEGAPFSANEKIILIEMIEREKIKELATESSFKYFYSDVVNSEDIFDFEKCLMELYESAEEHAKNCVDIFPSFSSLLPERKLYSWLPNALKFVDCIIIHYIQDVLKEDFENSDDLGKERSRYKQINRKDVAIEIVGRTMDVLYKKRSEMEHRTKNDPNNPGKQILKSPKFGRIKKKVQSDFPKVLNCLNEEYKKLF